MIKEYNECGDEVRQILDSFDFEGDAYKECDRLLNELEPHGYTFEYGLDGEPYNLKKLETMTEELSIMVWDVIFYTEDEEGNQKKYRPKDKFDYSHIAESVDFEDLEAIEEVEEVDINQLKLEL